MLFLPFFLLGLLLSASMGKLSVIPSAKTLSHSAPVSLFPSFDASNQKHRGPDKGCFYLTNFAAGQAEGTARCCRSAAYSTLHHTCSRLDQHIVFCRWQI